MSIDLEALEQFEKEASPGPWEVGYSHWGESDIFREVESSGSTRNGVPVVVVASGMSMRTRDAELLTEFRNAAPELIRLARLGKVADRLSTALESLHAAYLSDGLNPDCELSGEVDAAINAAKGVGHTS